MNDTLAAAAKYSLSVEELVRYRKEYVELRKAVVEKVPGFAFDDTVRARLAHRKLPLDPWNWVSEAHNIVNDNLPCPTCLSMRCPDGCCCAC